MGDNKPEKEFAESVLTRFPITSDKIPTKDKTNGIRPIRAHQEGIAEWRKEYVRVL